MSTSAIGTPSPDDRAGPDRPVGGQPGTFGKFEIPNTVELLRGVGERFGRAPAAGADKTLVGLLRLRAEAAELPAAALRKTVNDAARLLSQRPEDVGDKLEQAQRRYGDRQADLATIDQEIGRVRAATSLWRRAGRRRRLLGELERTRAVVDLLAQASWEEAVRLWGCQDHQQRWDAAHRGELVRARVQLVELQHRQQRALDWLQQHPPAYLTALLGAPPASQADTPAGAYGVAQWRRGALEIESYRAEIGVDDPVSGLGDPPTGARSYRYQRAVRVVEQVQAGLVIDVDGQGPRGELTVDGGAFPL